MVELLAVIVVLGIILLIAVPSVSKMISVSREKMFESKIALLRNNLKNRAAVDNTSNKLYYLRDLVDEESELMSPYGNKLEGFAFYDCESGRCYYSVCVVEEKNLNTNIKFQNGTISCFENKNMKEQGIADLTSFKEYIDNYNYFIIQKNPNGDSWKYDDMYLLKRSANGSFTFDDKKYNPITVKSENNFIVNSEVMFKPANARATVLAFDGEVATLLLNDTEYFKTLYKEITGEAAVGYGMFKYNFATNFISELKSRYASIISDVRMLNISNVASSDAIIFDEDTVNLYFDKDRKIRKVYLDISKVGGLIGIYEGYNENQRRMWVADDKYCMSNGEIKNNGRNNFAYCTDMADANSDIYLEKQQINLNTSNQPTARMGIVFKTTQLDKIDKLSIMEGDPNQGV